MNLFTKQKQTQRHRKQICGYQREKGGGVNYEFGTNQIHSAIYKIDKQQGFTVQHRELYLISCNNL